MFGLILCALIVTPKKYESEGKLFVRLGRGGVTLDPTATTSETIMIQESRESEINSIIDFLRSRGVLDLVVNHPADPDDPESPTIGDRLLDSSSLQGWVPSVPNIFGGSGAEEFADGKTYEQLKKNDRAIEALYSSLTVKAPRKASSISIACRTEAPLLSQRAVEVLMNTYIEQHVKARQTDGSFSFFEAQFEVQKELVSKASAELAEFKNKIGVMRIDSLRSATRSKIADTEMQLSIVNTKYAATKTRYDQISNILGQLPSQMVIEETEGAANQGSDLMRDRLYTLQLQEQELLARLNPSHPQVLAVREQLVEANRIMTSEKRDRTLVTKGVNKNFESLRLDLMNAKVQTAAAESEKVVLTEKLKQAKEEMVKINNNETRLAELQRYLNRAESNFQIYSEKREEARINLELDSKNISNVKIIQEPTLQVKHVSPRYKIILLASLFCSLMAGACLAVFLEQFDSKIRTASEVEDSLGIDVLTIVPSMSRRELSLSRQCNENSTIGIS